MFRFFLLFLLLLSACDTTPDTDLPCSLRGKESQHTCPVTARYQRLSPLPQTPSPFMELQQISAVYTEEKKALDLTIITRGPFLNGVDQNITIFVGAVKKTATPYTLTMDPGYGKDAPYPVRTRLDLPHTNDIQIMVADPALRSYSPNIRINGERDSILKGPESGLAPRVRKNKTKLRVPLERIYSRPDTRDRPGSLGITVATSRDYVGFIDAITLQPKDESPVTATGKNRLGTPHVYPAVDPDSHIFRAVNLSRHNGKLKVDFQTRALVTDWMQTNFYVYFLPLPPEKPRDKQGRPVRLLDPSGWQPLPYEWFYYCGLYAPDRLYCKNAKDGHTYDPGYASRQSLEPPAGVSFIRLAPDKIRLEISSSKRPEFNDENGKIRDFAVLLSAHRDGFKADSWYGYPF